jgi:hypothetical protein
MKLIKLQSEQNLTESVFNNNINVGYSLPAKCQVALKNVSMDFENPLFEIIDVGEDKNNNFYMSTDTNQITHDIELSKGNYTLNELIQEIQKKMNNALRSFDNNFEDYGFQWDITSIETNNTEIRLLLSFSRADPITLNAGTVTTSGVSYTNNYFYKTIADDNNKFNGGLVGNTYVNKGGFEASVIVDNQASPNNLTLSNWIFGIDDSKFSEVFDDKDVIRDLMHACVSNDNGYYTFKKDGILVQPLTPIPIAAGDIISINKKLGNINYMITKGSTTVQFVGDNINNLLPDLGVSDIGYVIKIGNDTGKIAFKTLKMTPNPLSTNADGIYTLTNPIDVKQVYLNTNLSVVKTSKVLLNFYNKKTRNLLGFLSQIYTKTLLSGIFQSDTGLSIGFLNNDLEIEIIELGNINSYSQTTKQLRGTIAVIPKASLKSSVQSSGLQSYALSYDETASWCWLSLDNDQPIRIPSLTVRATSNNELIPLNGVMSICLLFKSETESS